MARIIQHHHYPSLPTTRPVDLGRVLLVLMQVAVVGGIGLFLALAIVNTIIGAPQPEPAYTPYQ